MDVFGKFIKPIFRKYFRSKVWEKTVTHSLCKVYFQDYSLDRIKQNLHYVVLEIYLLT